MVDTLILGLNGYEVRPGHRLTVQPAAYVPATGEEIGNYRLWNGQDGRLAYYNAPNWHLDVKPVGGQVRGMVHLSLPGYGAPNNLNPVTREKAVDILRDVRKGLDEIGIDCCLEDARVSRLDAFANVQTSEAFDVYTPILSLLDGRRMREKAMPGVTSFRWGSTHAQINCYDKLAEMQSHKLDVSAFYGTNILRFEHRSLDWNKVHTLYGISTVGDFLKEYDSIPGVYRSVMQRDLFRYDGNDIELLSERQLTDEMQLFKAECGRRWMQAYWEAAGLRYTLQRASPETVARVIEQVSGDRNKAWRNRQKMHTALVRQKMLTKSESAGKTYRVLYNELRSGVLKAA